MFNMILLTFLLFVAVSVQGGLIWEDNFDYLDEGKWRHLVTAWRGGNDEFQYYRNHRKNSYVENGVLKIRPTPVSEELSDNDIRWGALSEPGCSMEPCVSQGGYGDTVLPVFSARIHTQGTFDLIYGRVEVRAKLPMGDWLWPSIWMYPREESYGGWPASGEIDIVESRGNRDLRAPWGQGLGADYMGSTLHWGPYFPFNGYPQTHYERNLPKGQYYSDNFHIYEVEWTPDHITFRLDGAEIGSVWPPNGGFWELGGFQQNPGGYNPWAGASKMAPFDRPFYLMLNVAVGGRFFSDDYINGGYPRPWDWNSGHPLQDFYEHEWQWLPTWQSPALEVDYIRIYSI